MRARILTGPKRMLRRVVVAAILAAIAAGICASAANAALPYHTNPTAAFVTYEASHAYCMFNFNNPTVVLSYTTNSSYVWWRPIGAIYTTNGWAYKYGEWRRALATSSRMVTWWESLQMFGYNAASGANQIAGWYRAGVDNVWLGYQLWYASKGGDPYTLWLFQSGC